MRANGVGTTRRSCLRARRSSGGCCTSCWRLCLSSNNSSSRSLRYPPTRSAIPVAVLFWRVSSYLAPYWLRGYGVSLSQYWGA
eukprot:518653-Rhodomonas_salina.1